MDYTYIVDTITPCIVWRRDVTKSWTAMMSLMRITVNLLPLKIATGSFSKVVLNQGAVKKVFLGLFH